MYDIFYLLKGVAAGLIVSIPLGPMGLLIIQKTLNKGALSGFVAGMGAASADFFYALFTTFGLGFIFSTIQTHQLLLKILGGIFLIVIGLSIYFRNPLKQIRERSKGRISKTGLLGDYLSLFFLTISNPITIIVFMAVFASMSVFGETTPMWCKMLVVSGVLLGGGLWWYTVSILVNIFRKRFRLRVLITINKVSGIIISVLGALIIISVFIPFLHGLIPT